MTDDELERALFALPLEEPPTELRARILAATIDRPRLTFAAWEIWALGTVFAFTVWLACLVATSVPNLGGTIGATMTDDLRRLAGSISPGTLMWSGLGMSFVVWVSTLSLPQSRRAIVDR